MQKFVSQVVGLYMLSGANLVAGEGGPGVDKTTLDFGEGTKFMYSTQIVPETLYKYQPCIDEKLSLIEAKKKALLETDEYKDKEVKDWQEVELPQADLDELDTCKPEEVADDVPEEEARKVKTKKILNGYLEVDQHQWARDVYDKTQNNDTWDKLIDWKGKSIRICLQYYPEFDKSGDTTKAYDGHGSKKSNRYRVRFVNKAVDDFTFHSEVATYRTDKNIDYGKSDDLEQFCNKPFQPKQSNGSPDYMEEITKPKEDQFGYAVVEQIINTYHRRFSIHFMRPLEQPEETQDLTFNEEESYKVFVNWGIYEDEKAKAPIAGQFFGYVNNRGMDLPEDSEANPILPLDMKIQVAAFSSYLFPSVIMLFALGFVFA